MKEWDYTLAIGPLEEVQGKGRSYLPSLDDVLRPFRYFKPTETKCVILGQDPHSKEGHADGLAFSSTAQPWPKSLRAVINEMEADVGWGGLVSGSLESWAKQGVLLLNRVLTVRPGKPGSHEGIGWEDFTTSAVQQAIDASPALVLVLWGRKAQSILPDLKLKDTTLVIMGGHPSPLNRTVPFRGGRYFSRVNAHLRSHGIVPIDWRLE